MNPEQAGENRKPPRPLSVSYKAGVALDSLIDALPDAVFITDPNWYITAANRHATAISQLSKSGLSGKNLLTLFPIQFINSTAEEAHTALVRHGSWKGDVDVLWHQRTWRIQVNCSLICLEEDSVHSYVVTCRNTTEQITTVKRLESQKVNYTTLAESLAEGIIKINRSGEVYMHNNRAAEIFGLAGTSFVGSTIQQAPWTFLREDGSSFPIEEFPIMRSLRDGIEFNQVIIGLQRENQDTIWLSCNSRPIFQEDEPTPSKALASFMDVTEIRRTTEKLRESEAIFRTFMKNSPTLAWIYDEAGNYVYGNPHFQNIVGLSDDAVGKPVEDVAATNALRELVVSRNRQVIEKGAPVIAEDEVPDKRGLVRSYLSYWFLLPITDNRRLIGGHAVEITDRKRARKAVDEMFERYAFAVNASADAIWDYDYQAQTIFRNDAFFQLTGYKKNEISNTSMWFLDCIHPQDQRHYKAQLDSFIHQQAPHWEMEYRFRFADNSYHYILDRAMAIYEGPELIRVIGAMQDVTLRKQAELQQLNEQVQKQRLINQATLQAQEQERNRISGELHDNVNQLLMSAKLHLGVAKNVETPNPELLAKASVYLSMAVDEIRNLSRKLNSSMLRETGLLASVHAIANDMHTTQEIDVIVDLDQETLDSLDEEKTLVLYRVIQEQSSNILKYAACSQCQIQLISNERLAVLSISDNGKGFNTDPQKMKKGLGFTNMRNRVGAYGGTMQVESAPEEGCVLRVSLPILAQQPEG